MTSSCQAWPIPQAHTLDVKRCFGLSGNAPPGKPEPAQKMLPVNVGDVNEGLTMMESQDEAAPEPGPSAKSKAWSRSRKWRALVRGERGSTVLEMALILPLLCTILVGVIVFGIAFNNQITLTNATTNAAQVLSAGSGAITDPCATANTAFASAAPSLNNPNISGTNKLAFSIQAYTTATASSNVGPYTVVFSGSDPSCATEASSLTANQQVFVTATYGCNLVVFGHNFAPSCILTAQSSEVVQ